jgi:DUF1680 family protein
MNSKYFIWILIILSPLISCDPKEEIRDYPITPVPFTDVKITDHFWSTRIDTNTNVTIPFALQQCETTGRLKNFRVAGGLEEGTFSSRYPFDDSDVFKIIEGAAYSLHNNPDPELENYLDTLISWIAAAQEDDGYLYTFRAILGQDSSVIDWAGHKRWEKTHLHSHELYNLGHMYEAAVAYYLATGKRNLLDIALRSADLVDRDFGPDAQVSYPGHQEIEIGLVRLYRLTGERRYLELARFFLDSRNGGEEYNQAHLPVTQQKEAVGHAVRATYMYSAMADMAALTGDTAYIGSIDRIWEDVVGTKLYITGGIGAAGNIEGFSEPYDLPNETAYCETCAGIANVLWNQRMFLLHGDAKYVDVLERTLYNNILSGISMTGDKFFYPNPLESHGQHHRSEWFACACCPSNICRFIPSVPGYIYAHGEGAVYINLFISSYTDIILKNNKIGITQNSGLPWEGDVEISIDPARTSKFALKIRIPGWVSGKPVPSGLYSVVNDDAEPFDILLNDEKVEFMVDDGYAVIEREWNRGDRVFIQFPMGVSKIKAGELVKENHGKVALQRGPLVYCVESLDYSGDNFDDIILPPSDSLFVEFYPELLNGFQAIQYSLSTQTEEAPDFFAIPYYTWAHRGSGEMKVWLPN